MEKKTVLEQALLEAQDLEEAVKSNAKEILAATMKQEIEELVKESLTEQEEIDFDDEKEDLEDEVSVDELPDEEEAMVSMDIDTDEPLDLTQASDEEVLKVFKAMGAEDGIVVRQDEDFIEIEDQEAGTEYKIELAENKLKNYPLIKEEVDDENFEEMNVDLESEENQPSDLEEALYEIELDDEELDEHQSFSSRRHEREGMDKHWGDTPDDLKTHLGHSDQGYDDREDESLGMLHRESQKYGGNKGDESMSKRDFSERQKYGGNKGDESMSRRDFSERQK